MNLAIKNISRAFQQNWALRDVSLLAEPGQTIAILGANGAGKSTLLRLIAGWLPVSAGRITIDDRLVKPTRPSACRLVMLLDEPRAHEGAVVTSIADVVSDYQIDRLGIEDEVIDWFERLDLVGVYNRTANTVSKGQRYKVTMVGLFLINPHVWLLDEPFSCGLDAGGLQILEQEMKRHVDEGGIVLFSSQWPEHARRLADQVWVIEEGELAWNAPTTQRINKEMIQTSTPSLKAVLQGLNA